VTAADYLEAARKLGLLTAIAGVLRAIFAGKPKVAERLAKNAALAAGAKLAARERIKRLR